MSLLDQLSDHMDLIEHEDEESFKFLESIKIQKEENPDYKLSGKQFKWLCDIHTIYCGGR